MPINLIQNSFQFGEVSELMHARVDSPIYYHSVKRLRNMLVIPQGGAKRRFGTVYVDAVNNHAGSPVYITDYTQVQGVMFDYEDGADYLLIFRENAIDIYWNNVYQSTTTTTYAGSEISAIVVTQSANIIFIAHPNHFPATLIRSGTSPVTMTLNASPTFINYPTYDFSQNYDSTTFQIKVSGSPITTTNNVLGQVVTVVASTSVFNTNHVGGLFFGDGGVVRLTAYSSGTNMTGRILTVFDADSALFISPNTILGTDAVLTEIAFSSTRGYPSVVSFYQGRIYFANTSFLPGGLWGSNYNGFSASNFNFDDSDVLDNNAVSTVLLGNKAVLISHIIGFKTLLIFTTSGLYSSSLLSDTPITPNTAAFLNIQTSDATGNVDPIIFENNVIFFDKGGQKVKLANIAEPTQHYQTRNISVLSPHLVDVPVSAASYQNSTTEDGSWLFMINSGNSVLNDGTALEGSLAVYQSVPEQEINAWSLATTDGLFRGVTSDEDITYFIVERIINGQTRLFIEQLDFNTYTDATAVDTQTLSSTITGLDYLEGKTVRTRGKTDDMNGYAVMASQVVTGGSITVDFPITDYQVGLEFDPLIVPLPVNVALQSGNNLYQPKLIKNFFLDYYQSLAIKVNGTLLPFTQFNLDTFDNPATPKTGQVQLVPMSGWSPDAEITITQTDPLPLTVIGFSFVLRFD